MKRKYTGSKFKPKLVTHMEHSKMIFHLDQKYQIIKKFITYLQITKSEWGLSIRIFRGSQWNEQK